MSSIFDKIDDWKKQLEKAKEYGLLFDKETVAEMIQTIEHQREMLARTRKSLRLRKQEIKTLQNAIVNHKQEIEKTKDYHENLLATERMNAGY